MNVFHILNSPQCCSNEALTITSNRMSAEFEHPWDTCTGLAGPSDAPHEGATSRPASQAERCTQTERQGGETLGPCQCLCLCWT